MRPPPRPSVTPLPSYASRPGYYPIGYGAALREALIGFGLMRPDAPTIRPEDIVDLNLPLDSPEFKPAPSLELESKVRARQGGTQG